MSAFGLMAGVSLAGCASQPLNTAALKLAEENSPKAEQVAPREALRLAETFIATHPGAEILLGSGGSMLPLYADHTVLVIRRMKMAELRPGMTVIFLGDHGRTVAHTLVAQTSRGWVAMGLSNDEPDRVRVRPDNYLGTVVKAYEPRFSPTATALAAQTVPAPVPTRATVVAALAPQRRWLAE